MVRPVGLLLGSKGDGCWRDRMGMGGLYGLVRDGFGDAAMGRGKGKGKGSLFLMMTYDFMTIDIIDGERDVHNVQITICNDRLSWFEMFVHSPVSVRYDSPFMIFQDPCFRNACFYIHAALFAEQKSSACIATGVLSLTSFIFIVTAISAAANTLYLAITKPAY